jgi:hypothetical protein
MTDSLAQLEAKRTDLFRQLAAVGDFRRGSISPTSGKCGKPNCHCSKRGDPAHGPNFRLTHRVEGKTVTETFSSTSSDVALSSGPVGSQFTDAQRGRS